MRIENALRAFGLNDTSTISDLNRAYHILMRRYLPERHPDRPVWARQMVARINRAYDMILDHLAVRVYQDVAAHLDAVIEEHDRFTEVVNRLLEAVLDGIYIFYQYGLENVHRRREGVWRMRFRSSVRRLEASIEHLQRLDPPTEPDTETLSACLQFARAFYQNMLLESAGAPPGPRRAVEAYRHYRAGAEHLDTVVKRSLFAGDLFGETRPAPHSAHVCHNELLRVVIHYSESAWVADAAVKLCVLEAVEMIVTKKERLPALSQDR